MKPQHRLRALADLRQICTVKLMGIEMQVERANANLHSLENRRDDETKALTAAQGGWHEAVSGRSLQLATAAFWSTEVLRVEAEIERLDGDIDQARSARLDLYQAQTAAGARCDAVDDLRRSTRRVMLRQRDEVVLDTYTGRAAKGWAS